MLVLKNFKLFVGSKCRIWSEGRCCKSWSRYAKWHGNQRCPIGVDSSGMICSMKELNLPNAPKEKELWYLMMTMILVRHF